MQCVFAAAEEKPEKEGKEKVGIFPGHPASAGEWKEAWLLCLKEAGWGQLCSVKEWWVPAPVWNQELDSSPSTHYSAVWEMDSACVWPIPAKSSSKNVENLSEAGEQFFVKVILVWVSPLDSWELLECMTALAACLTSIYPVSS